MPSVSRPSQEAPFRLELSGNGKPCRAVLEALGAVDTSYYFSKAIASGSGNGSRWLQARFRVCDIQEVRSVPISALARGCDRARSEHLPALPPLHGVCCAVAGQRHLAGQYALTETPSTVCFSIPLLRALPEKRTIRIFRPSAFGKRAFRSTAIHI